MEDLIKREKKIQEKKKQNVPKAKKISFKAFLSFINRSIGNSHCVQEGAIKMPNWAIVRSAEEDNMKYLQEMLKNATKQEKIVISRLID